MPSSPRTPTRRRKSSSIDLSFTSASPQSDGYSSRRPSYSRKSSQYSIDSPVTPRPISSHDRTGSYGFGNPSHSGDGNGLGNLADELAEAWDEEGDIEVAPEVLVNGAEGQRTEGANGWSSRSYHHDLGIDIPQSPVPDSVSNLSLSPPKQPTRSRHRRQNSQYDGSDYGDNSDLECTDGLSPSLEARMTAIENLARRGTEANGSDNDGVIKRVADSLKELPSQSSVENGATRLITAHAALTTHLSHQSRSLLTLTHPLVSPLSAPPDPEVIEELLPLLAELLLSLPTPTIQCLSSLHGLHASTTDLQSTLTYLSDTVYMTRQTSAQASRKLKTASEMVMEMRREAEAREEGIRWIEKGGWEQRLAGRECARLCGDVVGGFEEVCNGWRERLAGGVGLEVGAA